jgi:hypothetical protein
MADLAEGEERPTAYLRFIDGILHQKWEVGCCSEINGRFRLGTTTKWKKVDAIFTGPAQENER